MSAAFDRALDPSEVEYLHSTYHRIASKPWFTDDPKRAEVFASRLVTFFQQLDIPQDRFADFAEVHARKNFRRRVRFEEDIASRDH